MDYFVLWRRLLKTTDPTEVQPNISRARNIMQHSFQQSEVTVISGMYLGARASIASPNSDVCKSQGTELRRPSPCMMTNTLSSVWWHITQTVDFACDGPGSQPNTTSPKQP